MEVLESRGYQILYVGRPGAIVLEGGRRKTLTAGPDIVAVRNGRTVVVEAKGSKNTISLSSRRMRSTVGPGALGNSRRWLATNPDRYLDDLFASDVPSHQQAASLLEHVARNNGEYDAVFIGAGGRGQRFGRIDDVAETVSGDAGSVGFITTHYPDL